MNGAGGGDRPATWYGEPVPAWASYQSSLPITTRRNIFQCGTYLSSVDCEFGVLMRTYCRQIHLSPSFILCWTLAEEIGPKTRNKTQKTMAMKRFHYTLPCIINVNGEIVPVHVMKTLHDDEWSTSCPGGFIMGKKSVPIQQETGWAPRAGLNGFGEPPQYEMVKTRAWEKWVLLLIIRHPEKHPTPLPEIDLPSTSYTT